MFYPSIILIDSNGSYQNVLPYDSDGWAYGEYAAPFSRYNTYSVVDALALHVGREHVEKYTMVVCSPRLHVFVLSTYATCAPVVDKFWSVT